MNVSGQRDAAPPPEPTTATGPDLTTMRQLVDERTRAHVGEANRRVKVLSWVAMALAVVALAATGALAYYTYYHGLPGITSPSIRANEMVLVDRSGQERGYWRVDEEGTARMTLVDPEGVERLRLSVRADGEQAVALADGAGAARLVLALLEDNSANVAFADARGQTRTVLGLSSAGAASLLFTDPMGGTRGALGVAADGSPTFWWPETDENDAGGGE